MIAILPAPDHVVACRLTGTLERADIERMVAVVEERLARHENLGILADVTGFEGVTLGAALSDLHYSLGKIFEWHRFPREAVIVDGGWIETLTKLLAPIVPRVTIRTFHPEQYDAALAWAGDIEGGPEA